MSRAKRIDRNQPEIVKLFRELGAKVAITSDAGNGFPDLVVQFRDPRRKNYNLETLLVEIKDPLQPPGGRQLTPKQKEFHAVFNCHIVETDEDVFDLLGMTSPDGRYAA